MGVQRPVAPLGAGFTAAKVGLLIQVAKSAPAFGFTVLFVITKVSVEKHSAFVIFQTYLLISGFIPTTTVLTAVGVEITPPPLAIDHCPLSPVDQRFPFKVVLFEQEILLTSTLAIVGWLFVAITSSKSVQPFQLTVQRSVFAPLAKLLTTVVLNEAVTGEPLPTGIVHIPVPGEALVAFMVIVPLQVSSGKPPAFANT